MPVEREYNNHVKLIFEAEYKMEKDGMEWKGNLKCW